MFGRFRFLKIVIPSRHQSKKEGVLKLDNTIPPKRVVKACIDYTDSACDNVLESYLCMSLVSAGLFYFFPVPSPRMFST
jgi:hypothetical protein